MKLSLIVDKLPDRPSKLIRLGLRDLRKVERDARYRVDMGRFHVPVGRVCEVCLAGAVMACSLKVPRSRFIVPWGERSFVSSIDKKLSALDDFRLGNISKGCVSMGVDTRVQDRVICPYDSDKRQFYVDMCRLANEFVTENN